MNKIHISGYGSILYFIYRSTFIAFLLPLLSTYKTDAIWVSLIGGILGYFILGFFLKLAKKNPYDNIIIALQKLFPKGLGFLLNTGCAILVAYFSVLLFGRLVDFTGSEYLSGTSSFWIGVLFILTILYIAFKNIETISRASLIFFLISLALLFVKFSGLWSQIDLKELLPLFTHSPVSILKGSAEYAVLGILPLFLLLLINPKEITPTKRIEQKTKWFYLFTNAILLINIFLILTVLGPRLLSIYQYPEFHLLRNVKFLGFMDKLESLLSIQWIIDMILCISVGAIYLKTFAIYYIKILLSKFTSKVLQ